MLVAKWTDCFFSEASKYKQLIQLNVAHIYLLSNYYVLVREEEEEKEKEEEKQQNKQ